MYLIQKLINELTAAETTGTYEAASQACLEFLNSTAPASDKEKVKQAMLEKGEQVLQTSKQTRKAAERFLEELAAKRID